MIRIFAIVCVAIVGQSFASATEPTSADVFVAGQDSYFAYRIPALLTTKPGTLLAFCEGRLSPDEREELESLVEF